jgi:Na+-translocating ferredoxin:NAD+ oxidoreductase RnfG subunit
MPATPKSMLHEYFTFSKKERRAVLILAMAAVLFALLPVLFPALVKGESDILVDEETEKQLAAMRTVLKEQHTPTDDEQETCINLKTKHFLNIIPEARVSYSFLIPIPPQRKIGNDWV